MTDKLVSWSLTSPVSKKWLHQTEVMTDKRQQPISRPLAVVCRPIAPLPSRLPARLGHPTRSLIRVWSAVCGLVSGHSLVKSVSSFNFTSTRCRRRRNTSVRPTKHFNSIVSTAGSAFPVNEKNSTVCFSRLTLFFLVNKDINYDTKTYYQSDRQRNPNRSTDPNLNIDTYRNPNPKPKPNSTRPTNPKTHIHMCRKWTNGMKCLT